MENKETKYMVGTEGGLDYIVVAEHAEVLSIGLKPVMVQQNGLQIFIGFRVRCCDNRPDQDPMADAEALVEKYPTLFKWEKQNETRCSSMYGSLFPIPFGKSAEDMMQALADQKYYEGLIEGLSGMFNFTVGHKEIMDFIQNPLQAQVVGFAEKLQDKEVPEGYQEAYAKLVNPSKSEDTE